MLHGVQRLCTRVPCSEVGIVLFRELEAPIYYQSPVRAYHLSAKRDAVERIEVAG